MPTAHLIHGYIGAGKTTFARQLEQDVNAARFTHDEWMSTLYGEDPPAEIFADRAARISSLMQSIWSRCLILGVDVVLDFGFWTRRERDAVRLHVVSLQANFRLYRLEASDDIAWDRVSRRNADPSGGLYIAHNTFELLKARFEPLSPDEARLDIPDRWKDDAGWTPRPQPSDL